MAATKGTSLCNLMTQQLSSLFAGSGNSYWCNSTGGSNRYLETPSNHSYQDNL